jgi:predicted Fe-Mo cluster-binding NifX family protein
MYWTVAFYCNKSKNRPIPKDLGLALLTDPKVFVDSHQQMLDYNWQVVAEHFIDEYPEGGFEILRALVQQHADWRISLRIGHGGFRTIARQIIRLDPIRSWEIVSQMIECLRKIDLFGIGHWLGDNELFGGTKTASLLCEFPLDLILRWAGEEPASRALFVAGIAPKTMAQDHPPFAREILIRFGQIDGVSDAISSNFWSSGWQGLASDYFKGRRDEARKWLQIETSPVVVAWLDQYIARLNSEIDQAKTDEERRF